MSTQQISSNNHLPKQSHMPKNLDVSFNYRSSTKRMLDLIISALLIPSILPMIGILWLIARSDGGSGFFAHERIGKDGRKFKCFKIRSMRQDAEKFLEAYLEENEDARIEWENDRKLKNDPRISKFGGFIRKTSLDELPQLINVIAGDMSLVGPRPVVEDELNKYGNKRSYYLSVKPGITGLWQVSGRNDVSYDERVQLDMDYFKRMSLALDLKIILMTAFSVMKKSGY